jgi:hypothetical protein
MSPVLVKAIEACLTSARDIGGFDQRILESGFYLDRQRGNDVRWRHEEGYEAFVSQLPNQSVCSVWFDGDFDVVVSELDALVRSKTSARKSFVISETGPTWDVGHGATLRLFAKEGTRGTVGAALFVSQG